MRPLPKWDHHHEGTAATFDFAALAELFPAPGGVAVRQHVTYKRFDAAADAIRYAIEEMTPDQLIGAVLEVTQG
jgi:hypothetical protein